MKKTLLLIALFFLSASSAEAANRFWVGGTGTWDASDTTHWAATTGGGGGASVPGSSDAVIFDSLSGGGTATVNTNFTILSLALNTFTGTLDFSANNNSPTIGSISNTGSGVRTFNMGSGTWTLTGSGVNLFAQSGANNLTFSGASADIVASYSGSVGTRSITLGNSFTVHNLSVTGGSDTFSTNTGNFTDVNLTGFTGTWSVNAISIAGSLTVGTALTTTGLGVLTFNGSGANTITTSGTNFLLTGFTFAGTGSWTLQDDLISGGAMVLTSGTLDANNHNVTATTFTSNNANTRSLVMGNGTWTMTGTGTVWILNSGSPTFTANSSTIKITDSSATARTFFGGGKTYNNLWLAPGAGTATTTISSSNTFNDFKDDGTAAHGIAFTIGTTQHVTTFSVSGTPGNLITISSSATNSHALVKDGGGTISSDYLNIQHSVATPANTWYAGTHSINNQAVVTAGSGWIFTAPPLPSLFRFWQWFAF